MGLRLPTGPENPGAFQAKHGVGNVSLETLVINVSSVGGVLISEKLDT